MMMHRTIKDIYLRASFATVFQFYLNIPHQINRPLRLFDFPFQGSLGMFIIWKFILLKLKIFKYFVQIVKIGLANQESLLLEHL